MKKARRCLCLLGLGLWLLSGRLDAAEPDLSVLSFNAEPNNFFRWGHWSEAVVRLRNAAAERREARLVVRFPSVQGAVQDLFVRELQLPAKSQMEVKFLIRFPLSSAMPKGDSRGFPVQVRLVRDQAVLAEENVYAIPRPEDGLSALWCESGENGFAYQLKKSGKGGRDSSPAANSGRSAPVAREEIKRRRDFYLEIAAPSRMPHRLAGYDAYDLVALSGWGADRLDALQTDSLLHWVRQGGQLIVVAGDYLVDRPNLEIARALPLWPSERYRVSALPEIETFFGDLGVADGIAIMDGPRAESQILLGNEDQPILLRRSLGLGNIYFLALDVDRNTKTPAEGMIRLFQAVFAFANDLPSQGDLFSADPSRALLDQLIAVRIAPRSRMALWLGIYGLTVIGSLAAARVGRRPEWGYGAIFAAAIGGFVFLQNQSRIERKQSGGQIEQAQAYVAELKAGGSDVFVSGMEGFFPSTDRTIRFEMEPFDSKVASLEGFGGERAEVIEFQTLDLMGVASWKIPPNTLRAARWNSLISMEGSLRYSGRLTREGLLLDCESTLPWPLREAFLQWRRLTLPIPDLVPRHRIQVETWRFRPEWGRFQASHVQGVQAQARGLLRQMLIPDVLQNVASHTSLQKFLQVIQGRSRYGIAVGGFADQSPVRWKDQAGSGSHSSLGLWLAAGEEHLLSADPEFFMPPGIAEFHLAGKENRLSYRGGGNFAGSMEDLIFVKFRLPSCLSHSTMDEMTLHGAFDSLYFTAEAQAAVGSFRKEPSSWTPLEWGTEMRISNPGLMGKEDADTCWVRVRIARRQGARPGSADAMASLIQNWSLRGLDLSARGKLLSP